MGNTRSIKYFEYRETSRGGSTIAPIYSEFGTPYIEGSWLVLPAHFFGVSYVEWLHYCEAHGARLIGKNQYYVMPIWDNIDETILNELNQRTNELASKIDLKGLKY